MNRSCRVLRRVPGYGWTRHPRRDRHLPLRGRLNGDGKVEAGTHHTIQQPRDRRLRRADLGREIGLPYIVLAKVSPKTLHGASYARHE